MQQFFPYEELKATFNQENELCLETPWTNIQLEYEPQDEEGLRHVLATFHSRESDHAKTEFLANFRHNFVSYSKPRALTLETEHCSRVPQRVQELEHADLNDWAKTYVPAVAHQIHFTTPNWKWNVEEILKLSQTADGKTFDPESAYRAIMRLVLLEMSSQSKGTKLFVDHLKHLAKTNEELFFTAAKMFVRQYHHITSTSSDCLMPAMYNMPYAQKLVMELAHEEQGHGKFTASTFRSLGGGHPYEWPVDPYTVGLMDLLRQAAHTNALAFATLFTIFEVSGEQDDDPLATLLAQSSRPQSGDGLEKHFKLNKEGAHFQSGFPLIDTLQGVDRESVIEATRFAEMLMHFFDLSALKIIRETQG